LLNDDVAAERDVIAEVRQVYERYEEALLRHDVETLNAFFLVSPDTVRYGLTQQSYGFDAIAAYRRAAAPVPRQRRLLRTVISVLGRDVACVSSEFTDPVTIGTGRQTQTWLRTAQGWKIAVAHVSTSGATR
jgi:ketosteroid isomerase-like protein